jgi:hypothetical protein
MGLLRSFALIGLGIAGVGWTSVVGGGAAVRRLHDQKRL